MSLSSPEVVFSPVRIGRFLCGVVVLLILASTAGQIVKFVFGHPSVYNLVPTFFLGAERNVPTYFSSFLLLAAAVALGLLYVTKRTEQHPFAGRWGLLGVIFLMLSVDEVVGFHEMLIRPMREFVVTGGVFYFGWVLPAMGLIAVLGAYHLPFLRHLPRRFRLLFVGAAVIYLGGAVGVEMLGGAHADAYGIDNPAYRIYQSVEESLELFGLVLFLYALLRYIENHGSAVRLCVRSTPLDEGPAPQAETLPSATVQRNSPASAHTNSSCVLPDPSVSDLVSCPETDGRRRNLPTHRTTGVVAFISPKNYHGAGAIFLKIPETDGRKRVRNHQSVSPGWV